MNTDALQEKFGGASNFWWVRWNTWISPKYGIKNGKAYEMKRCNLWEQVLVRSSRHVPFWYWHTFSWPQRAGTWMLHWYITTWGLCRETQRTAKFFCWPYKPDGKSSMTAILSRGFSVSSNIFAFVSAIDIANRNSYFRMAK